MVLWAVGWTTEERVLPLAKDAANPPAIAQKCMPRPTTDKTTPLSGDIMKSRQRGLVGSLAASQAVAVIPMHHPTPGSLGCRNAQ